MEVATIVPDGSPWVEQLQAFKAKQAGVPEKVANRLGPKAKALLEAVHDAL